MQQKRVDKIHEQLSTEELLLFRNEPLNGYLFHTVGYPLFCYMVTVGYLK